MKGKRVLIALKGILFLVGYCEQMDVLPSCPNQRWHLFFMLDYVKATYKMQTKPFSNYLAKSRRDIKLMTHFSPI